MFFLKEKSKYVDYIYPLRVQHKHIDHLPGKRTSQSASEEGAVTVEAAMIVPLLLCAFLAFLMMGRVFLIHQEVESALLATARQIARQEALLSRKDKEGLGILSAGILLEQNRKQGGEKTGIAVSSLRLTGSSYRKESKEIYLEAEYEVTVPLLLLGTWRLPFHTSVLQKAWNGYAPIDGLGGRSGIYVYVTEHGTAYHKDGQCYHLHITVDVVKDTERYYGGETRYRPCEFCVESKERKDTLFVTEEGGCYHEDPSCSGLTRTVRYVPIEEAEGRMPCEDCCKE